MKYEEQKKRNFWAGVIIVGVVIVFVCVVLCVKAAMFIEVDSTQSAAPATVPAPRILYTDDVGPETQPTESTTYFRVYYPLTMDERDLFAELVAGKAVGEPAGCQQAVATVLLNTLNACGGDVATARKAYTWDDVQTPTDDTYDAVDAVFVRGELLLDDDVLYFCRSDCESARTGWHSTLELVCTIGHHNFYREH